MIEVLVRSKRQKKLHPLHGVDIKYYNRDSFIAVSSLDQCTYDQLRDAEEIMIHIDYSDEEEDVC